MSSQAFIQYVYIYIYIYMCVCVCVCVCTEPLSRKPPQLKSGVTTRRSTLMTQSLTETFQNLTFITIIII